MTYSHTRAKGNKGEDIACIFLKNKGYKVVARNYQKKWGELDIVATKDKQIHFFEVKSVTTRFTAVSYGHKPEDNVHGLKTRHIGRMIQTYLNETKMSADQPFSFHVLCVYMNMQNRRAHVEWLQNIIL